MSGQQKRAVRDIIATLAERFPACFSLDRYRKPLKVGIHDEVLAALPAATAKQVGLALTIYTSSRRYLLCIREALIVSGLAAKSQAGLPLTKPRMRSSDWRRSRKPRSD